MKPVTHLKAMFHSAATMAKLESLQCPFNWEVTPMPEEELRMQEPLMSISEPAWDNVSCRISAAYSLILDGEMERARGHLVRLYMILLDIVSHSDNSLRRYRPALKHVVDSMWIWFFLISHCGYLGLKVSNYTIDSVIERLIDKVTPFDSFSEKQKAAIYVLHVSGSPTRELGECLMERALAISPNESAWHSMQGWLLQEQRMSGEVGNLQAEIKALERSVGLHRNCDNLRMLAFAYFGLKTPKGYKKAELLMRETLEKWPRNVMVLNTASFLLVFPNTPLRDIPAGLECLERAVSIVGENSYLHFQIGTAYFLAEWYEEAREHLNACRELLMPEAEKMLSVISERQSKKKKVVRRNVKPRIR